MPSAYKIAASLITISGIAIAAFLGITRLIDDPAQPGAYRLEEVRQAVGYGPWVPGYVPSDLRPTSGGVGVLPNDEHAFIGFQAQDGSGAKQLSRGLSIHTAPVGALDEFAVGRGENRRTVTIRNGAPAVLDSWNIEVGGASNQKSREIRWTEGDMDFLIVSSAVSDQELIRVAESLEQQ